VGSRPLTGSMATGTGAVRIGGNAVWGEYFAGLIDDVRIYDRALSAAQIASDMGTPVGGWLSVSYGFNDAAGAIATDTSGHNLHGTVSGAQWTTGRFGGGLRFNGTSDWVTIADSSWLALTTQMTLEAWVYPTAAGGWRTILMKQSPGWYTFALYSDGSIGPGVRVMAQSDGHASSAAALPLNAWSHLAATYDGSMLRLFVNGAQVASTAYTGSLSTSTSPLRIGGNSGFGEYFAGVIDEVRVYGRVLTPAEIAADMTTPVR
jgi:Concanavalin A-like lectin/glucanases superfamily